MNDSAGMCGVQRIGNLGADIQHGVDRHGAAGDSLAQRLPFEYFHHQVRAAAVLAHVIDRADAGMIQRGSGARFALKSFKRCGVAGKLYG